MKQRPRIYYTDSQKGAEAGPVVRAVTRIGSSNRGVSPLKLLPLDDCLYSLQSSIPHLTRSSLHRCLQRHGISRLQDVEGDKPQKKKFKAYPIGYFHIDIAEVQTDGAGAAAMQSEQRPLLQGAGSTGAEPG